MNNDQFLPLALQTLLNNTADMLFFKDAGLIYRGGSEPFASMVGAKDVASVIGKTDFEILPAELALAYTEDDKRVLKSGKNMVDKIEPLTDLNGKKRYSSTSKFIIRDEHGNAIGLCGLARDVTAQITLLEEIEQRELSNQMFDDVFEGDITDNVLLKAEGSSLAVLFSADECATFTQAIYKISRQFIHPDHQNEFVELYSISRLFSEFADGNKRFSHTVLQSSGGDIYRWVTIAARLYFSSVSGTLRILMFFTDVDEERRSRDQLRKYAQTDSLTGLLNRSSVIERITECISGYGHEGTHALLFIDIDKFKQINDNYGHVTGDNVLAALSKRLRKLFRKEDILGRIGGDEFLVLLKNVTDEAQASELVKTVFKAIGAKPIIPEIGNVTCSVGVSIFRDGDKSFDTLYAEADKAMYSAKQLGKNRAEIYSSVLDVV